MNNHQTRNLKPGDRVRQISNGRATVFVVDEVRHVTQCVRESAGAYGQWAVGVTAHYEGTDLVVDTSFRSDEYIRGEGYRTHDPETGERLTGYVLLDPVTEALEEMLETLDSKGI